MAYNKVRIQLKRDTFENWNSCEQPLLSGEFSYDIDNNKIKIGDGITLWKDLPYVNVDLSDIINVNDLSDNAVISSNNWTQSQNYTTYNYVKYYMFHLPHLKMLYHLYKNLFLQKSYSAK